MAMKKSKSIVLVFAGALASAALLVAVSSRRAVSHAQTTTISTSSVTSGLRLPNRPIYALTSDNAIYVLTPGATQYTRLGRVSNTNGGNLIGIDFRPADNRLYGLTDQGTIYTIDVSPTNLGGTRLVSTMNPRFTGGFGVLVDFNPVLNALRVAGSNDQNLAVVNSNGGNLNAVAAQTKFAYAQGDVNFGKDPEIVGGAYNNNRAGAANTLFYLVDHDPDTLVTIAGKNATGSSNTGAGQLQTIGRFVDANGNSLNMSPTSDFDIYTDANGKNFLVGQTTRLLFTVDLSQINPNLAVGQTQRVVVARGQAAPLPGANAPLTGGVFDIAIPPQ
jgi:Domain of unknown function (DUF4394)